MVPVAGTEATRKGRVAKFKCPREALPFSSRVEDECLEGETTGEETPIRATTSRFVPSVGRTIRLSGDVMVEIEYATLVEYAREDSGRALHDHSQAQVSSTPEAWSRQLPPVIVPVRPRVSQLTVKIEPRTRIAVRKAT